MDQGSQIIKMLGDLTVTFMDYPDEKSAAVIVFFSGCKHNCPGCHNHKLQNFDEGIAYTLDEAVWKIDCAAVNAHTNKVVFSGGDILYRGAGVVNYLLEMLNKKGYEVCIYTGFDIDYIKEQGIQGAKFYKTGVYDEELRDNTSGKTSDYIRFATTNQRLYGEDYKQLSVKNTYYFTKWKKFLGKFKKLSK